MWCDDINFANLTEAIYLATNLRAIIILDGKAGTSLFCHNNIWNNVSSGPKMTLRQ